MASIIKRGTGQYQVKIRRKGFPTQTKTFDTLQDAKDWASLTEAQMRKQEFVDTSGLGKQSFKELLDAYLAGIPSSDKTHQVRSRINAWVNHPLGDKNLSELVPEDFVGFVNERLSKGIKTGTIRRDLSVVAAVFNKARDEDGLPIKGDLLASALKKAKPSKGRDSRLPAAKEQVLLEQAKEYNDTAYLCVLLALETGMRRGELAELSWHQIDLQNHCIILQDFQTKNKDVRVVPLSVRAESALAAIKHKTGKVLLAYTRADSISKMFARVCKRAGIAGFCFHDLRHEAASRLAPHVTVQTLAKIMGWRDLQMAMRYYNPTAHELVKAVREAEEERNQRNKR